MERKVWSRVGIALIIVGSIFILSAGAAWAAGESSLRPTPAVGSTGASAATLLATDEITPTDPLTSTTNITPTKVVPAAISMFFGVPVTEVLALRSEGLGYGVIAKAYFLAQDSGMTVDEILALFDSGMGWGEVATYLGVAPGNHGRNLGSIISGRAAVTGTVPVSGTVTAAAQRLAAKLGAEPEDVAALLDQGASPGAVAMAYKLANQFGVEPEDLMNQRTEGANWGQIKLELKSQAQTEQEGGTLSSSGGDSDDQASHGNKGNRGNGKDKSGGHGRGKKH